MKRKIIKQGKGGFTIYLPHKWVESKRLGFGDEVDVDDTKGELVIRSNPKGRRTISLELKDTSEYGIRLLITNLYRVGYDSIHLHNVAEESMPIVREIVSSILLGFEITDTRPGGCTIESVSEPTEDKYESIIKRIHYINKECMNILANDVKNNKYTSLESMKLLKMQMNKYVLFCLRLITRGLYEDNSELEWEYLKMMMFIQHSCDYLYAHLVGQKIKLSKGIITLIQEFPAFYDVAFEILFKKDATNEIKFEHMKYPQRLEDIHKQAKLAKGGQVIAIMHIYEMHRLIQFGRNALVGIQLSAKLKKMQTENTAH